MPLIIRWSCIRLHLTLFPVDGLGSLGREKVMRDAGEGEGGGLGRWGISGKALS